MDSHHVPSLKLYFTVFGILMVGTALTVLVAFYDLGPMNNVMMLTIAIVKALFVVLYFMHVRWSSRLTWVVAASGFFWLLIMFTFTMTDYLSRGWLQGTSSLSAVTCCGYGAVVHVLTRATVPRARATCTQHCRGRTARSARHVAQHVVRAARSTRARST